MKSFSLVTGGTSGIGLATAEKFAKRNHDLLLVYNVNTERAIQAVEKLQKINPTIKVEILQVKIGKAENDARIVEHINSHYQDRKLENVVFCHGRVIPGLFLQTKMSLIEDLINEHLISSIRLTHMLLQRMCVSKYGRFVFISSMSSHKINRGQSAYSLSKAALETFVKSLTSEYYHRNVTFNCVSPGVVRTGITQQIADAMEQDGRCRPIMPDEVADLINFLCSESAASISGSTIKIEGGQALMNNNLDHHKLSFYTQKK